MAFVHILFFSAFIPACVYTLWSLATLVANYRRARTMEIPIILQPVSQNNILWMVFESHVFRLLDKLPIGLGNFKYSRRGWFFADKASSHLRLGPAYSIVTPREVGVFVADPQAINSIFSRRGDFLRPIHMYKLLEVYGPVISTADFGEWPRHRKVLAAPFNESIMKFVWDESVSQTRAMLAEWVAASADFSGASSVFATGRGSVRSTSEDIMTLSLNVLAATGFKRSFSFRRSEGQDEGGGFSMSYRDALGTVLENSIFLMLVPYRLLQLPIPMPAAWSKIGKAAAAFKRYMIRMLDEETAALSDGKSGSGGIMTGLVRALDEGAREDVAASRRGLSVDEIFGNIYAMNFAGHMTTANTITFAITLLAAHPEVQDWLSEEIRKADKSFETGNGRSYEELFPRLVRIRAVLLETLRLYPTIPQIPKCTNDNPQVLTVKGQSILIPPRANVSLSLLAVQTHPDYWGPDPLTWRPSRWICKPRSPGLFEELKTPRPFTYLPWSDGPQNCLGEKFSQVEFVAVLATLFREHHITVAREADETWESAKTRVLHTVEDCDLALLLRMKNADRVKLVCKTIQE